MDSLKSKIVIITGAGSGIGAATAIAFAKHGANLVLSDINSDSLKKVSLACKSYGVDLISIQADVSHIAGASKIVNGCLEHYNAVDILVNNAGMLTQAPISDLTLEMWDRMLEVDLKSVYLMTKLVLPHMQAKRWGRIINISSQLGIKGGAELSHYCAAKAGVIAFSKSIALEVSKDNVLVNCVAPGPINTPLVDGITEAWKVEKAKELPLERFGAPEEVAPAILFLASEPGGNLFVGQTLGPNSGDVMP